MSDPENASSSGDKPAPVACTLSEADLSAQAERWTRLWRSAGLRRVETDDGLRLTFHDDGPVEDELRALVAVESTCCAWATWTVAREDGALAMHAVSSGEGVATLHLLLTRPRLTARRATHRNALRAASGLDSLD